MIKVPAFLLKRLYVKGSLRNMDEGFAFLLKNSLGSGYAEALLPLKVDGKDVPLADSFFLHSGEPVCFTAVTKASPFTLGLNRETSMQVKGHRLEPGPHRLGIGFTVVGLGDLSFEVVDEAK